MDNRISKRNAWQDLSPEQQGTLSLLVSGEPENIELAKTLILSIMLSEYEKLEGQDLLSGDEFETKEEKMLKLHEVQVSTFIRDCKLPLFLLNANAYISSYHQAIKLEFAIARLTTFLSHNRLKWDNKMNSSDKKFYIKVSFDMSRLIPFPYIGEESISTREYCEKLIEDLRLTLTYPFGYKGNIVCILRFNKLATNNEDIAFLMRELLSIDPAIVFDFNIGNMNQYSSELHLIADILEKVPMQKTIIVEWQFLIDLLVRKWNGDEQAGYGLSNQINNTCLLSVLANGDSKERYQYLIDELSSAPEWKEWGLSHKFVY